MNFRSLEAALDEVEVRKSVAIMSVDRSWTSSSVISGTLTRIASLSCGSSEGISLSKNSASVPKSGITSERNTI